jgi:NADH-quinone oxidoreductase subunit A
MTPDSPALWPLAVHAAIVVGIAAAALVLTSLLGPRHSARRKDQPYESGIASTGGVHVRFPVRFYLVAIAFLVFDLEAAYLIAWAVAARQVGWTGFIEVLVFIAMLFAGLVYLWGKGALDWGPRRPAATTAETDR